MAKSTLEVDAKIIAMTLAVLVSLPTAAQISTGILEEVVVTATKREQGLSDIGISVTSISGREMSALGLNETIEIVAAVPNLVNASVFGPGSNTNFSIRGVAQNDFNDGTESPNALYVDEVYLVPTGAGSFPLYDMDRVEVLRGPQGTFFGRNSTGGLIHFISQKPTDEFAGSISTSYGSHEEYTFEGMLNIPLGDAGALRISGKLKDNDGWSDNISGNQPDGGQIKTESLRAQLLLTPSDTFDTLFKVSYDEVSGFSSNIAREPIGISSGTGDQFVLGPQDNFYGTGPGLDAVGLGAVGDENSSDNGQNRELIGTESLIIQNTSNWEIGDTTITSVAAFNRYEREQTEDCDGTQTRICTTHYDNESEQFTLEVRAFMDKGGFRLTYGGYYLDHEIELDVIAPFFQDFPSAIMLDAKAKQEAEGLAAFANIEYDLSDEWTLIVGARVSRDEKEIDQINGFFLPLDPANPFPGNEDTTNVPVGGFAGGNEFTDATIGSLREFTENTWSGKLELDYKPDADTLIYGSISRGIKSAGFNNGFITVPLPPEELPFDSEELLAFELGYKTLFWDQKASVSMAAFYYDYSDFQTVNFVGAGSFITNKDGELYGAEAELTLLPIEGLTIRLSGGTVETELRDVSNAGGVEEDREMALAPSWTLSGMARYEFQLQDSDKLLGFQIDGNARDSFFNDPGNNSAAEVPSFHVFNAHVTLSDAAERFRVTASVKNLTDKQEINSIFLLQGLGGYRALYHNRPRWYSIDFTYNF